MYCICIVFHSKPIGDLLCRRIYHFMSLIILQGIIRTFWNNLLGKKENGGENNFPCATCNQPNPLRASPMVDSPLESLGVVYFFFFFVIAKDSCTFTLRPVQYEAATSLQIRSVKPFSTDCSFPVSHSFINFLF